jgi:hypothetical protein
MNVSWTSAPAPTQIHYASENRDYVFAFWSITAFDSESQQSSAQIQNGITANDSHQGGTWSISANAFYIWNFGEGGGDNAILIDAFDVQAGDFIADDFVNVTPDQNGKLTTEANNGYIDTSTDILPGLPIAVSARDSIYAKQFGYWINIPSLLYSNDPNSPATVGSPNSHDIVAHYNDVVVAFAFYNEVIHAPLVASRPVQLYIPRWRDWWGPVVSRLMGEPWRRELVGVLTLSDAAGEVSPSLQERVLEIALEQLMITSAKIKEQLTALKNNK